MDDQTKSALSSIAAIVFLSLVGVVLARPIFDSNDPAPAAHRSPHKSPRAGVKSPTRKPKPSPTTTPTQPDSAGPGFVAQYPHRCLAPAKPPSGTGLIAVAGRRITVSTPDSVVATFAGKGPIGWSPSGRYLALGDGSVWDSKSERKTLAVGGARKWTWSPRADCLLGMTAQGTLVVAIPGKPQKVLADGISSFTFAEGGRFLAVGGGREPNLALDLRKNRTFDYPRRVPGSNRCRVKAPYTSPTCSPDGRFVAAIRDGKLVLLQNGDSARDITEGPYLDAAPEWGPPRSGILFLRLPEGETDAEVWFFPEGGTVRRTPLVVPGARSVLSSKDFTTDGVIDWSATPPSGVPF